MDEGVVADGLAGAAFGGVGEFAVEAVLDGLGVDGADFDVAEFVDALEDVVEFVGVVAAVDFGGPGVDLVCIHWSMEWGRGATWCFCWG